MHNRTLFLVATLALGSSLAYADIAPPQTEPAKAEKKKKKKKPALKAPPTDTTVGTQAEVDDRKLPEQAPPKKADQEVGKVQEPVGSRPPTQPPGRRPAPSDEPVGKRVAPSEEATTVGTHQVRGRAPVPSKTGDDKSKTTYGDAPKP